MRKAVRMAAVIAVLAIIAAACSDSGTPENSPSGATGGAEIQAGGTLHLAQTSDVASAFDPQKEYYQTTWEYYRCCLVRTLLSTEAVPVEDGGGELKPDLATDLPTVSDDGLTYTFTIKPGIMYAPPLQDVEITAQDFIRALERESDPKASAGGYPFYYSVIEGFDDYGAGKADAISGLSAPDDHTLIVKITDPAGDLPWRFTMPATAPIPPNPADPEARLGVADGHTSELREIPREQRPVHVRGEREPGLLRRCEGPADRLGLRARPLDRPGPQPFVRSSDRRSASGVPGSDRGDDRRGPRRPLQQVLSGEVDYVNDVGDVPANVLQQYSTTPTCSRTCTRTSRTPFRTSR